MFENFRGKSEKMYATKLQKDNLEVPFKFEYYDDQSIEGEKFLSNLQMTSSQIPIITGHNLDWKVKDVILVGSEKSRYQVMSITKIRRNLPKNFLVSRPKFDYILILEA